MSNDIHETGAAQTDTEDAINALLSVAGSEVAILLVELAPDVTKVSLRSRGNTDVRQVAEHFGGGGHRAAAGVSYAGSIEDARNDILDVVRTAMR